MRQQPVKEARGRQETENVDAGITKPKTSLGKEIAARLPSEHKGDVGRPGESNESVFQGSKEEELPPSSNNKD